MRRKLPLDRDDLGALLAWCVQDRDAAYFGSVLGPLCQALERAAPLDAELSAVAKELATRIDRANRKEVRRYATSIWQVCNTSASENQPGELQARLPKPTPAPAGSPLVLVPLKRRLGMLPSEPEPAVHEVLPDGFVVYESSSLRKEHELVAAVLGEQYDPTLQRLNTDQLPTMRRIASRSASEILRVFLAAAERLVHRELNQASFEGIQQLHNICWTLVEMIQNQTRAKLSIEREDLFDVQLALACFPQSLGEEFAERGSELIDQVGRHADASPLSEGERYALSLWRASLIHRPHMGALPEPVTRLTAMIGDGANFFLVPGESWTDRVNDELSQLSPADQATWITLFRHATTATSSRPTAKWIKTVRTLIETLEPIPKPRQRAR